MNKLVQVKNIYKTFAGLNAVDGVSLEIDQGQFFSLLGPSGCGKTTLLRLIAGFEKPSSGEVVIDNLHMEGVVPNQRPTNMVFQKLCNISSSECGAKRRLWIAQKTTFKSRKNQDD